MPSSVDDQPSDQPPRPHPRDEAPPRRRPPSKAEIRAAQRKAAAPPPRRTRPAPARRPAPASTAVDDGDEGAGAPPPRTDPRQKRMVLLLSIATVVVIGLIGLAFSLSSGSGAGDDIGPPAPDDTPAPVTTFTDDETGISVEYPRAWQRVQLPVADYRLAVDAGSGSNVAFTIRVLPIQTPATSQNLPNFKAVTDGLVASNPTVKVLKEQAVTLNGMLGYYYFYTFTDGAVEAVHAHYFLFSGNKMNILVFQSLPDDFQRLAPTFDRIAESFRSDPAIRVAAPSTTTSTTRAP